MLSGMIRLLLATVLLSLAATPAAAAERRYSVADFDRVVVEGPYIVRIVGGRSSSAVASGDQEALDRVSVEVSAQTLRIRRNRNRWGGNPDAQQGPLTIDLATRNLRSVRILGPAQVDVARLEGLRTDLSVEGSGRIGVAQVDTDNLLVGVAGSGTLELAGSAKTMTAEIQGAGDLRAAGLRVDDLRLTTASSGSVAVEVGRAADVSALGLGSVDIAGRAACTVRGPGAGLVRCARRPLNQR